MSYYTEENDLVELTKRWARHKIGREDLMISAVGGLKSRKSRKKDASNYHCLISSCVRSRSDKVSLFDREWVLDFSNDADEQ